MTNGVPWPTIARMSRVTNLAAYRFTPMDGLKALRERLVESCRAWNLKGTILLSEEGINLFVAGGEVEIEKLLAELRALPGLETLAPKLSVSEQQPFNRMLVRIKKEIIAFGVDGIEPGRKTSRKLSAQALKSWLDEGRPVTLLDTRNDYEVKLGTFRGARTLGIDHFREFPTAVQSLPEALKSEPVVMFCTGGIRCEKAGAFLEREGYANVFQLDGGILKYFEEVGGAHYEGECFVFDQRVGVDPALQETESAQCFRCLAPLTKADQRDARYRPGQACPHCFQTQEEKQAEMRARRQEQIRQATTPLPGSFPQDNRKPLLVSPAWAGATLLDFLSGVLAHVPREEWASLCAEGRWRDGADRPLLATERVRAGVRLYLHQPGQVEPEVNAKIDLLYEDEAILVLHKPAPLPMHPCGRFNRNTLQHILNEVYRPQRPRPAHRLDADTTGLVVCARTRAFAGRLQPQFERGEVEKVYLARVKGWPAWQDLVCEAPVSSHSDAAGARGVVETAGLGARTDFRVRERFADGTALLEARPVTGRTNQIRQHLAHLTFPIVGDESFGVDEAGPVHARAAGQSPLCLHASELTFAHPVSGQRMSFIAEMPAWIKP